MFIGVHNLILAIFGIFFGAGALYDAYRGVARPGGIGSSREPIKISWYTRGFWVLGGLWAIYVAVYFLRR